jgi:hypothetical protein
LSRNTNSGKLRKERVLLGSQIMAGRRIDELARIRMMVRFTRVDDTSVSLTGSSRGAIVLVIVRLRITGTSGIFSMKNRDIRASLCILTLSGFQSMSFEKQGRFRLGALLDGEKAFAKRDHTRQILTVSTIEVFDVQRDGWWMKRWNWIAT